MHDCVDVHARYELLTRSMLATFETYPRVDSQT